MWEQYIHIAHAIATTCMVGVIWFVQVVHYPLMAHVGKLGFCEFESGHTSRTTLVVAPLMLVEISCASIIAVRQTDAVSVTGILLIAIVWLSTAALQVPCHRRLASGLDRDTIARLVATNWIRTIAWSARGAVAFVLLHRELVS